MKDGDSGARSGTAAFAGPHGFEQYRHGTLSLYAALDTQSGKVLGKTAARHTSQEFVEFLTEVVERAPARELHIILDNSSAHKS
jgi:transposase